MEEATSNVGFGIFGHFSGDFVAKLGLGRSFQFCIGNERGLQIGTRIGVNHGRLRFKTSTKLNKINSYLEVTLESDKFYSEGFYFVQYEHI